MPAGPELKSNAASMSHSLPTCSGATRRAVLLSEPFAFAGSASFAVLGPARRDPARRSILLESRMALVLVPRPNRWEGTMAGPNKRRPQ